MPKLANAFEVLTKLEKDLLTQIEALKTLDSQEAARSIELTITNVDSTLNEAQKLAEASSHIRHQDHDKKIQQYTDMLNKIHEHSNTLRTMQSRNTTQATEENNHPSTPASIPRESNHETPPPEQIPDVVSSVVEKVQLPQTPEPLSTKAATPPPLSPKDKTSPTVSPDPLPPSIELPPQDPYETAVLQINALKKQAHPEALDKPLNQLMEHVDLLKQEGNMPKEELIKILQLTYLRLTQQIPATEYEAVANTVQGKPSVGLKILGGLMLALSISIAALGLVFFPVLLGVAATLSLTGTAATVVCSSAVAGGTLGSAAASIGFFAESRASDLSKEMHALNEVADSFVPTAAPIAG